MRLLTTALLLSLLFVDVANGKRSEKFRDFSNKGSEYASLENLRFAAGDITYSGSETIDILGKPYSASKYALTVAVTVETLDAIGATYTSVYEKRPAGFEIFVVEDRDRTIHDAFVKDMYTVWRKKELFSGEYFFDFHIKNNCYVLTTVPGNVESYYFIWVNGHAVKILFKGFENTAGGGWGAMSSFTSDAFRISIDNAEFRAYEYPLRPQKRFVELYEKGFFSSPSSCD
ncbi:MAG: hypothetical protein ABSE45_11495 [Candidatus Acidiferrales bacterium]|jgi:hypothetical protein